MRFLKFILTITFIMTLSASSIFGQASKGSLSGRVEDATGAVIPGADVTVTSQATNRVFTTISNDVGTFTVPNLDPGLYTVEVAMTGFSKVRFFDVTVEVGETFDLVATMEIGEISETVQVTAGTDIVKTTNAQISTTINKKQIEELPLNGRNPLNLIQLNSGVANNARAATSIAGTRTSYTNITLDGVNIQDNFIRESASTSSPNDPNVSQVAEFNITTQNQGAETGGGANQISMVTPSGSNDFHGQVYWFHRNDKLSSNSFFNNLDGIERPGLLRNQFGVSASGPILKDKLLFFANYEGLRRRQKSTQSRTVLTPDMKNGIYTYINGDTGEVVKRDLFDLSGEGMHPIMSQIVNEVPASNSFGSGDSTTTLLRNTAGYVFQQQDNLDRDQGGFRLDFILNDNHSFEGIYNISQETDNRTGETYRTKRPSDFSNKTDFFSTAWQWTASPSILNEVRFGANLSRPDFTAEDFDRIFDTGKLESLFFSNPVDNFEPQGRDTFTWTIQDNASWQKGNHSFRFGFQSQYIRLQRRIQFDVARAMNLAYAGSGSLLNREDFPGIGSSDFNNANAYLADLAGWVSSVTQEFNVRDLGTGFEPVQQQTNYRYDNYSFYFGDTWRIAPRWTVNLGLRYELYPGLKERDDLISMVVPTSGPMNRSTSVEALTSPDGGSWDFISNRGFPLQELDKNNFAPSIGFAWDIFGDGKTSLRAGYGISYVNDESIKSPINAINRYGVSTSVSETNLEEKIDSAPIIGAPPLDVPQTIREINDNVSFQLTSFNVNPELVIPYVQTWNFGLTRELGWDTAVEVRYVGTKGTHLYRAFDYNQVFIDGRRGDRQEFFDDFLRARSNMFLSLEAGAGNSPYYNPDIPGSVELTYLPDLPEGGRLNSSTTRGYIERGAIGQLAYYYHRRSAFQREGVNFAPSAYSAVADQLDAVSSSTYHGGQIEVRRRFNSGLLLNANYTFSKVLTDYEATSQNNFSAWTDLGNLAYDRRRALFDVNHVFNANFIYELPWGRGRTFDIENSVLNQIAGGWQMTSIFSWQSGDPWQIESGSGTLNRDGRSGLNTPNSTLGNDGIKNLFGVIDDAAGRPNFISRSVVNSSGRAFGSYLETFDGQVFFHPEPGTLGSLPRNGFTGPSYFNWDFGLMKRFDIYEDFNLEFRAEFFNILNKTSFAMGDEDVDSSSFGRISSTSSGRRIIQFALKLVW